MSETLSPEKIKETEEKTKQEIVKALEELLVKAKKNEIRNIVGAFEGNSDDFGSFIITTYANKYTLCELLGILNNICFKINTFIENVKSNINQKDNIH